MQLKKRNRDLVPSEENEPKYTWTEEASIVKALKANEGNITKTARALGVTPSAVSQRISRSKRLQDVLVSAKEGLVDLAESELTKHVKAGSLKAILFVLETIGKSRGWIKRTEIAALMKSDFVLNIISPSEDDEEDGLPPQ